MWGSGSKSLTECKKERCRGEGVETASTSSLRSSVVTGSEKLGGELMG